jgi:NTP pyrophosphatase (non-canonical NTP hydrolase)
VENATRFEAIQLRLEQFRDERDWRQFHSLKDLASAIGIEASELQELFLWQRVENEVELIGAKREAIENELADVLIQCLNFAAVAEIDALAAVERKIENNELRYPVDEFRGSAQKASG